MKNKKIIAIVMTACMISGMLFPAQTVNAYRRTDKAVCKKYIIVNGQDCNLSEIKNTLDAWCNEMQNGNWKDCPTIIQPDSNEQGGNGDETNGSQIDKDQSEVCPDNKLPENDQSTSEADKEQAGSSIPDTEAPSPDQPDISIPETSVPEQNDTVQNQPDREDNQSDKELSFEEQIVKLVNEERAKAGLHALTLDAEVTAAARIRTKEIQNSFSHTRPDGRKFSTVLTDNGIRYTGAGENIAWGQTTPEQVMKAWMNSEGHRANILNARFTKIGVGHAVNTSGRHYWTQLFTY